MRLSGPGSVSPACIAQVAVLCHPEPIPGARRVEPFNSSRSSAASKPREELWLICGSYASMAYTAIRRPVTAHVYRQFLKRPWRLKYHYGSTCKPLGHGDDDYDNYQSDHRPFPGCRVLSQGKTLLFSPNCLIDFGTLRIFNLLFCLGSVRSLLH